jgi:hypothetical protein
MGINTKGEAKWFTAIEGERGDTRLDAASVVFDL